MRRRAACSGIALALAVSFAPFTWGAEDAQRLVAGRRIYATQCAACHGPHGEGAPAWDQPNDAGELPAPPHNAEGHTWKHADAMLYRIVKSGWRDPFNKTSRMTMPAFETVLTPAEMRDVIDYLKTMWTPEQRMFQGEESVHDPFPPEALRAP